jgi:hypothetical protein
MLKGWGLLRVHHTKKFNWILGTTTPTFVHVALTRELRGQVRACLEDFLLTAIYSILMYKCE